MELNEWTFLIVFAVVGIGGAVAGGLHKQYVESQTNRTAMENGYEQVWDDGCECKLWKPTRDIAND